MTTTLRNLLFALAVILTPTFAIADTNVPDGPKCITIEALKENYPKSDFKKFTPAQQAFITDKFTSLGRAPPPDTKTMYLTVTVDNDDTLVIIAFGPDGCYLTHAQVSKAQFAELLGGLPKSDSSGEKKFDDDSSKPNAL